MINYIIRRSIYAIPILIGVNLLTFFLFFVVNSPEDMARMHLGDKRVSNSAIEQWQAERGYNKPLVFNQNMEGMKKITETIFYEKSLKLFVYRLMKNFSLS